VEDVTAPKADAATRAVLEKLPILAFLSPQSRNLVIDHFVPATFSFGNVVVREGDKADAFYVLISGKARVVKSGEGGQDVSLNVLKPGDSFGEIGLLDPDAVRSATVRASSEVLVARLAKRDFDELLTVEPGILTSFELHTRYRSLNTFFRLHTPFARLPVTALGGLLGQFKTVTVRKGDTVFRQGDPAGPLYAIEEGRLRVFVEADGQREYLRYLRKGDFFGEISVFRGTDRTASVEAVSDCKLLALAPEAFQKVAADNAGFRADIEDHIQQYDYKKVSRVPLDFAEEILPAQAKEAERVGPAQVDQDAEAAPAEPGRAGPFATGDGRFVKKPKKIRRFPLVRQIDEMDCGAACMAMICRHFGRAVSRVRIRELLFTSTDGTSLRALVRGAESLGLAARSVKASTKNVDQMPLPAIIHWGGNHWVVLYHVDAKEAWLADPAAGLRRVTRKELEENWTGYAALFDYTAAFERTPEGTSGASWLAGFFRPHARTLGQALALALVVSALSMVVPVFTQVIVDRVLVEKDTALLRVILFSMLTVLCFTTLAMLLQKYLLSFAAVRFDAATLDFLTRRLLSLPMTYFNSRRTGDIQRRLDGMRQIRELLIQHGVNGLTAGTQLVAAILLMVLYSPFLSLVYLATTPLYVLLMRASTKWLKPVFDSLEEVFGRYGSAQIDAIKGIETVKALGAESSLRQILLNQFHALAQKQFRADFTMMSYQGGVTAVTFLSTTIFLWAGAHQVMNGALTIGGLVAFSSLVALANMPITTLLSMWDSFQLGSVLLDRLNDVFDQRPEQGEDHSALMPVRSLEGRVTFNSVTFRYGGPESPPILDEVTFEAAPGKMIAIVGRSGSGKTTLIKCLSGLLEPTEGTILYDGFDMKTLAYRDLRRQVGFVLQENYLFDDTIARNIAFGEDQPDMDRVLWAARVANAHEFVERLPLGYETRIGESGIAISGGQRQRVAIARSIYHQPPILVFDEATSALDTESERAVKENLDRLLEGRTSFVIAHRLSTIRDADMILVLERGRLVEHGTHDELMARQGLYFYLSSQQLGM
jgi:ATP-binding cassette subfamily B protein